MNAVRNTSSYPTDEVRAILRFAGKEIDTSRTAVHLEDKPEHGFRGTAYPDTWLSGVPLKYFPLPKNTEYFVRLRLAPPNLLNLPVTGQYRKRAPHYCLYTWQESLLYLAAHEFKHIEEFREGLKSCEVRCEFFATHMLKQFRLSVCYNAPIKGNQGVAA